LGVLDPAVVGSLDFYSGVLPVRFGDRLSGALDMIPRHADDEDRWIFGLSPLYASAVTSGRWDAHDVEWLGAVRTSTIGLISDDIDERVGDPEFTDAIGRVEMPFGDGDKLVAGWMLLEDKLNFHAADGEESAIASYRDATGWLRGEFSLTDDWRLNSALSHTERHTTRRGAIDHDNATGSVDDVRHHDATTARLEVSRTVKRAEFTFGAEAQHYASDYEYRSAATFEPRFAAAFGRPASIAFARDRGVEGDAYAAYLLYAWEALPTLTMSAGMRYDAQRYEDFHANEFSPRLLFDWHPRERWRFRAAFGRTHQAERPDELQIQDGEDVFHLVQRADQGVLAVEHQVGSEWSLRVEAFLKHIDRPVPIYENLLDALVPLPELEVDRVRVAPRAARAYGVESTLRWQPAERWSGWLAYSWTDSQDEFPGFEVARTWDQRNAVNAGLSWTRRPWQLSGTVQWRSGWRRNALRVVDETTGELELLPRNGLTYPPALSLDLRATWTWALRASALQFYADIGNAGNRQTPCCTSYDLTDNNGLWSLEREYDSMFPRYVLLGVNWEIP
jgi:outer membrane receptor protein involved in Fe transport